MFAGKLEITTHRDTVVVRDCATAIINTVVVAVEHNRNACNWLVSQVIGGKREPSRLARRQDSLQLLRM